MKTKLMIIAFVVTLMVWVGVELGKWAAAESKVTEARYQQAVEVMRGN